MKQKPNLNKADIDLLKREFATKEEISKLATKTQLNKFATKSELSKQLAKNRKEILKETKKADQELENRLLNKIDDSKQEILDKMAKDKSEFYEK